MRIDELLMKELKQEWSRKGKTVRYIYAPDIDCTLLEKKVLEEIKKYETILKGKDISYERYMKAIKECLIFCRFLETLQMARMADNICPLDKEEYKLYQNIQKTILKEKQ